MNYYEILGVEPTATKEEIKTAYQKRAAEYHSNEIPQELNEAYEVLSDPYAIELEETDREEVTENKLTMTTERAVRLLKAGNGGVKGWNQFRQRETYVPSLEGVDLSEVDLQSANFANVNLKGAKLGEANLKSANFSAAILSNSDLKDADARSANFSSANLEGANLKGANIYNSNFTKAKLCQANLTESIGYYYNKSSVKKKYDKLYANIN
ncbi:MAG: pentapeptide repeat-containing protein [Prochloron sp. SP5CPC1]|nr:pentapeptide repeat-containing protein [Candidatus Paraprochloron terpiosi SP5CPC1]